MKPWLLGNTTVRSPYRLRDGLLALSQSALLGNLRGVDGDKNFRKLLGEAGVVELGIDATNSVSRKWRSALNKLGFLYPETPNKKLISQGDIGPTDTVTPNGQRLIEATSVPAMQECFLRALAASYIPSPIEKDYSFKTFSPLRHILAVMLGLNRKTGTSLLSFLEMAVIVQFSSSDDKLDAVVGSVLDLRKRREAAQNKRKFDGDECKKAAKIHNYVETTFRDYGDTNFRYLKATGLFHSKGRGITIVPEQVVFAQKLVEDIYIPKTPVEHLQTLCQGAKLPTDTEITAKSVLEDLLAQAKRRGIPYTMRKSKLKSPADINAVRHEVEQLLRDRNEIEYADRQAQKWEEIALYMELLISKKKRTELGDDELIIPQLEAPAYFEWVLWRAFLAIDSLINPPSTSRGFKIDQDFLPVGTAPGGRPDLFFDFKDFAVAVEVTLTDNSRQEAAEGESVRRHIADAVEGSSKPVYGLFLANHIDPNTAETFRRGNWYVNENKQLQLSIIPLTLKQFHTFFVSLFRSKHIDVALVRGLLDSCNELRQKHEAPAWVKEIDRFVSLKAEEIQAGKN